MIFISIVIYVCSRVYIKNYSRIFLEWIIAKKERLRKDKVFEFCNIFCFHVFISCNTNTLRLVFQKCSAHVTVLVQFQRVKAGCVLWSCLPSLHAGAWGCNEVESCSARLTSCHSAERWRVCGSLQMWPYFLVRARGVGSGVWSLWQ